MSEQPSISAASSHGVAHKLIRNTLFNSVGRVWTMAVAFLLTPFIVSHLGVERYGVWSLVFVVVGYFGLFDFGIGVSFVKYVAQHHTRGDHRAVNSLVTSGLCFYVLLSFALLVGVAAFGYRILGLFRVPEALYPDAYFVLVLAVLGLCLTNVAHTFEAIIKGLQRMEVTNLISVAVSFPQIAGTVLLLTLGYGLRGLIINRVVIIGLSVGLFAIWAYRLLPSLDLYPGAFEWKRLRELLRYGAPIQITALGALVNLQINKAFLGYFLGLGFVTFYDLGFKVVYTFISLPLLLVSAVLPAASEIDARRDSSLLDQLYSRGSKYLILVAAPLAAFIFFNAPRIMEAWMGSGYPESVQVIRILTLSSFVNLMTAPGTSIARGVGRPWYEARYAIVTAVIHIAVALVLIPTIGFLGAVVAAFLGTTIGSGYFLHLFHRHIEKPFFPFAARVYFKPILACVVSALAVVLVDFGLTWTSPLSGRWGQVLDLGMIGTGFSAFYLTSIWLLNYLDTYDRLMLVRRSREIIFPHTSKT